MKCPLCKTDSLQLTTLTANLPAHQCAQCQGIWLDSNAYLAWHRTQEAPLAEKAADEATLPTWDTQELKLCPACGRFLMRYRVLPNAHFWLDRCGHCQGIWFDQNEWEALVARNLHAHVHEFFTKPWQEHVREAEAHAMLDKLYTQKFGAADYARIQELWHWLKAHPQRAMLVAFLQAENPYKI